MARGHKRIIGKPAGERTKWELLVFAGRDPLTNKKRYKSRRVVAPARAKKPGDRTVDTELDAFLEEVGKKKPSAGQTLGWLIDRWLDVQEATLGEDTIRTYRSYKAMWIDGDLGKEPYADLTAGHLRELHALMASSCRRRGCTHGPKLHGKRKGSDKSSPCMKCSCSDLKAGGRSTSTIRQVHAIIRGALTYGMERYGLTVNIAAVRRAPKLPQSEVVACTDDELEDLLANAGEPGCDLWTAIALGATLGRRLGQLCTIQHSGVNLDARTVALRPTRKSPKVTVLPIDDETAAVLKTRLDWQQARWETVFGGPHPRDLLDDPYILSFVSSGEEPNPDSYTASFSRLRDKLGYKHLHFHCLRHWCATTLINKGVPLPVVAERLGHSSPAVTARIYAHVVAGRHDDAAAIIGSALPLRTVQLVPAPTDAET